MKVSLWWSQISCCAFHCFVRYKKHMSKSFYLWIASIYKMSQQSDQKYISKFNVVDEPYRMKTGKNNHDTPTTCLMSWSFTHYISLNKMTICSVVSYISLLRWGFIIVGGKSSAAASCNFVCLTYYLCCIIYCKPLCRNICYGVNSKHVIL